MSTWDPNREFLRMRQSGRATLPGGSGAPRFTMQQAARRALTSGSLGQDIGPFIGAMESPQRERMQGFAWRTSAINREFLAKGTARQMEAVDDMHRRRTANGGSNLVGPTGGMGGGSMSDVALAWPKMRDPFRMWKEKAWFWLEDDFNASLSKLRSWCSLMYMTHPLLPSLIDIYSKFPVADVEFHHKDQRIADFFSDLFLNELHYDEFLFEVLRQYWLMGEAFPLGNWHEGIGAWESEQLMHPDSVDVSKNPALAQNQFHIKVPDSIRELIETRQPVDEYNTLVQDYPQIAQWAMQNKDDLPVSDVLLKHLKFSANPWNEHGVPLLMRAFRVAMLEMSLEAAQDAVADRLYSPFILARIGIDQFDDQGAYIPSPEEIEVARNDISLALMSDFRLMVYHHGLDIESVFGRENMPNLGDDFDRVDSKYLQVFGIGREMIEGGSANVPYAAGAINRDLVSNMLGTAQKFVKRFVRDRMLVVADAQEMYEYERRGDVRVPVMERALMYNEVTKEEYVVERPKLAIPEQWYRAMDMKDENQERQFLMALKEIGIPVSDRTVMMSVDIDWDDELDRVQREKLDKTIAELEFQQRLFLRIYISTLEGQPLPIPMQYQEAYVAWVQQAQAIAPPGPVPDVTGPAPAWNMMAPGNQPDNPLMSGPEQDDQRPQESDEKQGEARAAHIERRVAVIQGWLSQYAEDHEEETKALLKKAKAQMRKVATSIRRREREEERQMAREKMRHEAAQRAIEEEDALPLALEGEKVEPERREEFAPSNLAYGKRQRIVRKVGVNMRAKIRGVENESDHETVESDTFHHGSFQSFAAKLPTPEESNGHADGDDE